MAINLRRAYCEVMHIIKAHILYNPFESHWPCLQQIHMIQLHSSRKFPTAAKYLN